MASSLVHAKILDKIAAVFNNKIITLSMVQRINTNLKARRSISPQIYKKSKYKQNELVDLIIHTYLIRERLTSMGYTVNDEQVEERIKALEQQLRINRKELLNFLKNNHFSYNEYFDLIRETIEYNIFHSKIIAPLISITEQQIKNTFYRSANSNKTLTFKYNLIDFSISSKKIKSNAVKQLPQILTKYQASGIIPERYKSIDTNVIGDVAEEGLTNQLRAILKRTDEGSFSKPILLGNSYHVFYLRKKDLAESSIYLKAKAQIKNKLFVKISQDLIKTWYKRESNNHYIKYLY